MGIIPLLCVISACSDVVPFPEADVKGDSKYEIPYAYFEVVGSITDTIIKEPLPMIAVQLRNEIPVLTDQNGFYSTYTSAFPIAQEFALIINPHGEHHNPGYTTDTAYVHYVLPTFQLTREDISLYGHCFFGHCQLTFDYILSPLAHE